MLLKSSKIGKIYILWVTALPRMIPPLPDLANVVAGAYKGYMNAAGHDVDATYLAWVLGTTSGLRGVGTWLKVRRENADPLHGVAQMVASAVLGHEHIPKEPVPEGIKTTLLGVPVGAAEIALGYGLGYVAQKIID